MNLLELEMFKIEEDGCLLVRGCNFNEKWRPWGHPLGFGVVGAPTDPKNGEIKALFSEQILRHSDLDTVERPNLHKSLITKELKHISLSIPQDVLNAIFHFQEFLVECVILAQFNQNAFVELANTNPALTILLAREMAMNPLWSPSYYADLLARKQKDITYQLGYGSSFAKFLYKFESRELCTTAYLIIAIRAWQKPGMKRLLQHRSYINLDVLILAYDYWSVIQRCPSILFIINEDPFTPATNTMIYEQVAQIIQLRSKMQKPIWPWAIVNGLDQLTQIVKKTSFQANRMGILPQLEFPLPPIPTDDRWEWLSDSEKLQKHSIEYLNCAETYNWKCLTGLAAIYVSRFCRYEDTVIVLIEKENTQRWVVADIVGPENLNVSADKALAARRFFEERLNNENT